MKGIHKRVKQLEDKRLDRQLSVIQAYKNDSSKENYKTEVQSW